MKAMYFIVAIIYLAFGVLWGERGESVFCVSYGVIGGMCFGLCLRKDRS